MRHYALVGKKELNAGKRFEEQDNLSESDRYHIIDAAREPLVERHAGQELPKAQS